MVLALIFLLSVLAFLIFVIYVCYLLITINRIFMLIPIFIGILMFSPFISLIEEYRAFFRLQSNISNSYAPLIDPQNDKPILMYRTKSNIYGSDKTIMCRTVIYQLDPNFRQITQKFNHPLTPFRDKENDMMINGCIDDIKTMNPVDLSFLAPFIKRNNFGSYLVYGSTSRLEVIDQLNEINKQTERYTSYSNEARRYMPYIILVDQQHKLVKITQSIPSCAEWFFWSCN
jgi:hypothetical protein